MTAGIRWKKELVIGAILLAVGLLGLPAAIYVVGQEVIGEYAPDAGMIELFAAIWSELARLNPAAWVLVLSPLLVISLLRLSVSTWRSRRPQPE